MRVRVGCGRGPAWLSGETHPQNFRESRSPWKLKKYINQFSKRINICSGKNPRMGPDECVLRGHLGGLTKDHVLPQGCAVIFRSALNCHAVFNQASFSAILPVPCAVPSPGLK